MIGNNDDIKTTVIKTASSIAGKEPVIIALLIANILVSVAMMHFDGKRHKDRLKVIAPIIDHCVGLNIERKTE